jgi:uncharacterized membrane protein HdeD (DUF308 family)
VSAFPQKREKSGEIMELHGSTSQQQNSVARQVASAVAPWWWAWLVVGILWILASFVILHLGPHSTTIVGIIFGVMLLAAGLQDFALAYYGEGWKWLWIAFGMILVLGGIYVLFYPVHTFVFLANSLDVLFLLIGICWIIEAFTTSANNPLWWVGLAAGVIMLGLGFWAGAQLFATQAYTLLIFAGIWALLHGITDIVKSFQIKNLGSMTASDQTNQVWH